MAIARRHRVLTARDLTALPPEAWAALPSDDDRAWARAALKQWGTCGVGTYDGARLLGWLVVAPATALPAGHPHRGSTRATGVVVSVGVVPGQRGHGIGRAMVQRFLASVPVAHLDAVTGAAVTATTPPAGWLEAVGFRAVTVGPARQVWRVDGSSVLRLLDAGRRMIARVPRLTPTMVPAPARRLRRAGRGVDPQPG